MEQDLAGPPPIQGPLPMEKANVFSPVLVLLNVKNCRRQKDLHRESSPPLMCGSLSLPDTLLTSKGAERSSCWSGQ